MENNEKKDILKMLKDAKAENKEKGIEGLTPEQELEIGKAICDNIEMD